MINWSGNFRLLLLLFLATNSFGQSIEQAPVSTVFRVNMLNPGLSYELPLGHHQTAVLYGGVNTSFGLGFSSSLGTNAFIYFDPGFGAQYRYYYNSSKRTEKGRRTEMNSRNYVAPVYSVIFTDGQISENAYLEEENSRPVHTVGAVWGIQRNYKSRFSLDLNLGLGYVFGKSAFYGSNDQVEHRTTGNATAIIHLELGFWLNKR